MWVRQHLQNNRRAGFGGHQFKGLGRIYKQELQDPQSVSHTPAFQASTQAAQQAARDPATSGLPKRARTEDVVAIRANSMAVFQQQGRKPGAMVKKWKAALVKPLRAVLTAAATKDALADNACMTSLRVWSDSSRPAVANMISASASGIPVARLGPSEQEHVKWELHAPTVAKGLCMIPPMVAAQQAKLGKADPRKELFSVWKRCTQLYVHSECRALGTVPFQARDRYDCRLRGVCFCQNDGLRGFHSDFVELLRTTRPVHRYLKTARLVAEVCVYDGEQVTHTEYLHFGYCNMNNWSGSLTVLELHARTDSGNIVLKWGLSDSLQSPFAQAHVDNFALTFASLFDTKRPSSLTFLQLLDDVGDVGDGSFSLKRFAADTVVAGPIAGMKSVSFWRGLFVC